MRRRFHPLLLSAALLAGCPQPATPPLAPAQTTPEPGPIPAPSQPPAATAPGASGTPAVPLPAGSGAVPPAGSSALPAGPGGGGGGGGGPAPGPTEGPHVVISAVPTASLPPTAEPAAPSSFVAGSKMVYVSEADDNQEVFLAAADGSSPERLTYDFGTDLYPRFSGDRREIVWCSDRGAGVFALYRMWADGQYPVRLTFGMMPASQPAFSPDGAKIAFVRWTGPSTSVVAVIDRHGGNEVLLSPDGGQAFSPTWSPDGTRLAFGSNHANPSVPQLYTMNADGTGLAPRTAANAAEFPTGGIDWSPDGTKLVYASYGADSHLGLTLINATGGGRAELTNGGDFDPAWSPDGGKIIFTTISGGTSQLAVVNADGSNRTSLTTGPRSHAHADW